VASAKGIRAGKAFVELGADDSKMLAGLKKATNRLRAFGQSVGQIGQGMARISALAMAPLIAATKVFSSFGDSVAKMAKRTGLSVEALSELRFAASQSGTDLETLEGSLKRMQRTVYDAGRGLSTATDALADLGVNYTDLANLKPEEQFKLLADRVAQVEDPTTKAALAMATFGRTGTDMLPMLNLGAKGIGDLQAEARRLGLTMSGKDAKAAEQFSDKLDRMGKVAKQAVFEVGAALAPALEAVFAAATKALQGVRAWVREQGAVIRAIFKITAVVAGLGVALMALGKVATVTAGIMKGMFLFAANPAVLAIVGIGAAALTTAAAFGAFGSKIEDTSHSLQELRDQIARMNLEAATLELAKWSREVDKISGKLERNARGLPGWLNPLSYTKTEVEELNAALDRAIRLRVAASKRVGELKPGVTSPGVSSPEVSSRADEDWARKVHQLKLGFIEDEYRRESALIIERYNHERQLAVAEGATKATLHEIDEARTLELETLEINMAKKVAAERQRIFESEQARRWRIEELGLRVRFKGLRLEEELLKLTIKRELIEAKALGERSDLIMQQYALEKELLKQSRDLAPRMEMRVIGTFNPNAIRGLQSSNLATRTAKGIEKLVNIQGDMFRFLRQQGGLVFS